MSLLSNLPDLAQVKAQVDRIDANTQGVKVLSSRANGYLHEILAEIVALRSEVEELKKAADARAT